MFVLFFLILAFQKFIDHIGDLLQAYVDRREQVYSLTLHQLFKYLYDRFLL